MNLIAVTSQKIKTHQKKLLMVAIGTFIVFGSLFFLLGQELSPPPVKDKISETAPIYDVTKSVDDKSFWVFKAENELKEQQKKQEKLVGEIEELKGVLKEKNNETGAKAKIETLQAQVQALEERLASIQSDKNGMEEDNSESEGMQSQNLFPNNFPIVSFNQSENITVASKPPIFSDTVAVVHLEKNTPHMDSYIPAGSYAKAVLLSGIDVSAGVSSQSTPKPVLLRLIHRGSLPNKMVGRMKECRIVAAAYGDLSSERAYLRLEKLSCIEPDGKVIETDVDGYISGEDGKNGMRGKIVMRDGEVLKKGFMGGLLSGLGKATSQSFNTTSISPLGAVSTIKPGDSFKQAGAEGAGNAFDMLARYNIQRAEQYQPVIQVSAGRIVDVVFHSGSKFGEKRVRPKPGEAEPIKTNHYFGDFQ